MKTFFIFLTIFLMSSNITAQHLLSPPNANKKEVRLINTIIKDYLNDEEAVVIFNPYAPLFIGIFGITYQYSNNMCLFSLSASLTDRDKRYYVLLHELGHVLDIMYGDLSEYPPMWKGKRMDQTLEWNKRPWEVNADEWAKRLWKKYLDGEPPQSDLFDDVTFHNDCVFHKWGSIKFKSE